MKKLVLIDSHALIHRAFHALPALNAPDGRPTNAVYGFTSLLLKMIAELKPDYMAAAFDLAGPTFRHEQYDQYKATRQKAPDELYAQIPMVREMIEAFGIPVFEKQGFEADDLIGTMSLISQKLPNLQTVIVTGDLDTLQLVHKDKVVVFTLRKGITDTVTYNEAAVRERYNLEPSQIIDFKGLKGDPSDNIPGVAGIGEKTASTLIGEFGTLEKVLKAATAAPFKKPLTEKLAAKLVEGHDMALFSKKLATIIRDVPVEFSLDKADWHSHADAAKIQDLCQQFGFYSLAKRVSTALGAPQAMDFEPEPVAEATQATTASASADDLPEASSVALHGIIEEGTIQALYLTTDGSTIHEIAKPSGATLASVVARYPKLIGHDIKALLKLLPDLKALDGKEIFDTHIAAWLIGPDQRNYGLDTIFYNQTTKTLSANQTQWPLAIFELQPILEKSMEEREIIKVYREIEMPLIPVLARMERIGIRVDAHTISDLLAMATKEVASLEKKIYKLAGEEFNISSPSQLGEILYTKLAIVGKVRRTGKGAPSTAAPELEKLLEAHPIIELVLQYRELSKLKNTYIEPFPSLIAADGRIHTTYNQAGAATGRMASNNPNLQNIPTRTELGTRFRAAFVAQPAFKLVSLDYSQLELRLVAHMAQDKTMIEAFNNGEDIHTRTASEIFGIAPAQVTKDQRRQAKVLNFGIIYGMGSLGFARAAKVSRDEAKRFIDEYFHRFAGVAKYMEAKKQEAFDKGYASTLLGRRRPLPDITSHMPQLAAAAERMAINHPLQGTGADLVKLAMIAVDKHIRTHQWDDDVRMLLQVHDELVMEIHIDQVAKATQAIRKIMEDVYTLDVPLTVDAKVGDSWADMKPLERE